MPTNRVTSYSHPRIDEQITDLRAEIELVKLMQASEHDGFDQRKVDWLESRLRGAEADKRKGSVR